MRKVCSSCGTIFEKHYDLCPVCEGKVFSVLEEEECKPGDIIDGRFNIIKILGKGGMGQVYKAYQISMDRYVAIKVLNRELAKNAESVKRFLMEAKSASKLNHPNIITLYDFGQTGTGLLYIVMELLDGIPLSKTVFEKGPLTPVRSFHILSQVCDALAEAHYQGIVHRDLKPDNVILLEKPGHENFVKVLDFGISKSFADIPRQPEMKTSGIIGTPEFLSPEQVQGLEIDYRADIYALGIVLYFMLSRTLPFQADKPFNVLMKHVNDPPPSILQKFPWLHISPELDDFIIKCLSKDPKKRPQSTVEFKEELSAIVKKISSVSPEEKQKWQNEEDIVTLFSDTSKYSAVKKSGFQIPDAKSDSGKDLPYVATKDNDRQMDQIQMFPQIPKSREILVTHEISQSKSDISEGFQTQKSSIIAGILILIAIIAGALYIFSPDSKKPQNTVEHSAQTDIRQGSYLHEVAEPGRGIQVTSVPEHMEIPVVPENNENIPRVDDKDKITIQITSFPSDAEVIKGGKVIGRTPVMIPGKKGDESIELIVKRQGYIGEIIKVKMEKDDTIGVVLKKKKSKLSDSSLTK
jgi:serine/threonine protein kinase